MKQWRANRQKSEENKRTIGYDEVVFYIVSRPLSYTLRNSY